MAFNTPKYIMVGGFLGAGKTTTIAHFGNYLSQLGHKVGLITNDQANGLVDTAMLRSKGFATEEIAGGCFCCRFSSLTNAAENLTRDASPDVFLAEPVGSCTDLVATVTYPLRRLYGESYELSPFSVLVDPVRARRVLGLDPGRKFAPKVEYIYLKQLQEAHAIVINKCDSIDARQINELKEVLESRFPGTSIFTISARNQDGEFRKWMDWVIANIVENSPSMEIDYDTYAEGEAMLGWLNATFTLESADSAGTDSSRLLTEFCTQIQKSIADRDGEIAHLKMTLSPHTGLGDIAIINVVRNDIVPELSQTIDEPVTSAEVVVNLRAEADPEILEAIVRSTAAAVSSDTILLTCDHLESFRPGRPVPEHRDAG